MQKPMTIEDYSADIAAALATPGGHLSIGRGGFTLHYRDGAMLSGYGCEPIKAQSIKAGLPVIDSRGVAFDVVVHLTLAGPLVAVGREAEPVRAGCAGVAAARGRGRREEFPTGLEVRGETLDRPSWRP